MHDYHILHVIQQTSLKLQEFKSKKLLRHYLSNADKIHVWYIYLAYIHLVDSYGKSVKL